MDDTDKSYGTLLKPLAKDVKKQKKRTQRKVMNGAHHHKEASTDAHTKSQLIIKFPVKSSDPLHVLNEESRHNNEN